MPSRPSLLEGRGPASTVCGCVWGGIATSAVQEVLVHKQRILLGAVHNLGPIHSHSANSRTLQLRYKWHSGHLPPQKGLRPGFQHGRCATAGVRHATALSRCSRPQSTMRCSNSGGSVKLRSISPPLPAVAKLGSALLGNKLCLLRSCRSGKPRAWYRCPGPSAHLTVERGFC